jgi:hypothetical protein
MTQSEILQRLNQLTLRYNLTWFDIKYDADKAIAKINNFMGTKYPRMSDILTSPESTYTLRSEGVDVPIFPTEYIHSIVIPYIATEVLARDEEFTTIYNKYMMEIEDGLFNMFQKEFNRVPFVFRQHPDRGVLFPSGSHQARIVHNSMKDLPQFKFRVKFYNTNPNIVMDANQAFPSPSDAYTPNKAYDYDEELTLPNVVGTYLSQDGATAYTFKGWTQAPSIAADIITAGTKVHVKSDLHYYAVWQSESTLSNPSGELSIKSAYRSKLTTLVIPTIVDGERVTSIASGFTSGAVKLKKVVLPHTSITLSRNAFYATEIETLIFPRLKPHEGSITIRTGALANLSNITELYIPERVLTIEANAIGAVPGHHITLYIERLEDNIPDSWHPNYILEVVGEDGPGTVERRYGYHG